MNCAQQVVAADRAIESLFEVWAAFVAFRLQFRITRKPHGG
jgi:hypothetical protein